MKNTLSNQSNVVDRNGNDVKDEINSNRGSGHIERPFNTISGLRISCALETFNQNIDQLTIYLKDENVH